MTPEKSIVIERTHYEKPPISKSGKEQRRLRRKKKRVKNKKL